MWFYVTRLMYMRGLKWENILKEILSQEPWEGSKSRITKPLGRSSEVLSVVMEKFYRLHEFEQGKSNSLLPILNLRRSRGKKREACRIRCKNRDGCCCHRDGDGGSETWRPRELWSMRWGPGGELWILLLLGSLVLLFFKFFFYEVDVGTSGVINLVCYTR